MIVQKPIETLVVVHVMRTYGAHGGENQLARYFAAEPAGNVTEHFAFIYRDPDCVALFRRMRSRVEIRELLPFAVAPRQNPWLEILILLPFLVVLQLRFLWVVRRVKPNVCVVHGVQAALVAWPAGMLLGRRIGFLYVHRITKAIGRHRLLRWLYAPYDRLAGVSRAVTRSLAAVAPKDRLITLENGIDWRDLELRAQEGGPRVPDGPVIITVGRLLAHKRQGLLIEAFARLAIQRPDLKLWIVGDGAERPALEATAARIGLSGRVVFWGYRTDVPRLLAAATVFANASAWEGMSNAVLEAMALGLASVVVDAPGVTECHVDGQTGLVVDADATSISEAVAALLDDPLQRARLGEGARSRVRSVYSIEANRRRFLEIYARLAEGS